MKYNIEKFITNTQGQYSATVSATFDDLEKAIVNYHSTLANLHNANDVLLAVVILSDEYGNRMDMYREEVDHRPEPEPQPEPEEPTEPEGE